MKELVKKLKELKNSSVRELVQERLREFKQVRESSGEAWFSELCYCLLTANSKASTALEVQNELGQEGFLNASSEEVKECIRGNKHRFHNRKTEYIINAREHSSIKEEVRRVVEEKGLRRSREFLALIVKGLGFKEASHFLRNVGYDEIAIIDRHVISVLEEYGLINEVKEGLTKRKYLMIEGVLEELSERAGMNLSELDLYLWYSKTGEVLK